MRDEALMFAQETRRLEPTNRGAARIVQVLSAA
jgi:hypothetical protein